MRVKVWIAGVVLALSLTGGAVAKPIPPGGLTADEVAVWLRGAGHRAEVVEVVGGATYVVGWIDGVRFKVFLFDCTGARCENLQLSAAFDAGGASDSAALVEWNRRERWARAYADLDNAPHLDQDVDLAPGGSFELLNDQLVYWRVALTRFRRDYLKR